MHDFSSATSGANACLSQIRNVEFVIREVLYLFPEKCQDFDNMITTTCASTLVDLSASLFPSTTPPPESLSFPESPSLSLF